MPISLRVVIMILLAGCTSVEQMPVDPMLDNQFLISRIKTLSLNAFDERLARSDPFFHSTFENAVCGDADAQYWAGFDNHHGIDLQVDLVAAQMWYSISAHQGHRSAVKARDTLASELTTQQRRQANRRATDWRPIDCITSTR